MGVHTLRNSSTVTGVLLFKHSCLHFLFADAIFLRGRTLPNLHDALHCDADILQLDVIAVGEVPDAAISAVVPEKCPVPCSETHGPLSNFPASNLLKLHMQMLPARPHHSLVGLAQSMVLQLQIQRSQSDGRFHLPKQALLLNYCLSSDPTETATSCSFLSLWQRVPRSSWHKVLRLWQCAHPVLSKGPASFLIFESRQKCFDGTVTDFASCSLSAFKPTFFCKI